MFFRKLLVEAGFRNVTVYWEGWDEKKQKSTGEFSPVTEADADAGWLAYLTAEK